MSTASHFLSRLSTLLHRRWLRALIGLAVAALLWTVAVGWALPAWLRPRIEAAGSEALGVPVTLGALSVQPWTLRVTAQDLRIDTPASGPEGAGAPPLLVLPQAEARLSLQSVWRRVPVLRSITLTAPVVQVARWAPGQLSVTPIIERLQARPAVPADAEPARFALHNIRIERGALRWHDRVLDQRHAVEGLTLGVPFLSNLASDIDTEVEPLLEARIDGSAFKLSGDSKPFAPGRPTELALQWSAVPLAPWAAALRPLLPPEARVAVTAGTLDTALTLHFATPAGQPARLAVQGRVALRDVQAEVPVASPAGGWAVQWSSLVVEGLDLAPLARQAKVGDVKLDGLRVAQGEPAVQPSTPPIASKPSASPAPDAAPWAWSVGRLAVAAPALRLRAPGGGALPVIGPVQVQAEQLDGAAKAAPAPVRLTAADAAGSRLSVNGTVQPAARRAALHVALADGQPLPWLQALKVQLPVQWLRGQVALDARLTAEPSAVRVETGELRLAEVEARDDTVSPAANWRVGDARLAVQGASTDSQQPIAVELVASKVQDTGRLSFKGTVRPTPLAVAGQLQAQALDLRMLQPYLAPHVNLTLRSAQAHADGKLAVERGEPDAALAVRWQGRAALTDLRTQDSLTGNDFVRWRSLALDGSDIAWRSDGAPLRADLGRVALDDFFGRVIVHPDGHLNLRDVRKQVAGTRSLTTPQGRAGAAAEPASASASASAPASAAAAAAGQPLLSWQRIALSNGRLDFSDNFVKPNYAARLQRLVGEVSATSASPGAPPAQVSLSGALDDGAPVTVKGRVQPFRAQLFADIEGTARGIELTRLSTYAERYAGYAIDKGSLTATVRYRVEDGRLEASNRLFLDQLTFGNRVENPTATQLPVLLAVSLLKNSRGEIDIDLPVAGSLSDPQFSIGGVITRVLGNLVAKAVTSPFALLAGAAQALQGGGEELGWVGFEPGSAQLTPAARDKLDVLAKQLADRPALLLEAGGRADATTDAQGLRARHVARLLRAAKAEALGIDRRDAEAAVALQISPEERDRWLGVAYRAAQIQKPRNAMGLARELPPAEMEALLMASADTGPDALRALADRRADRVNAYLDGKLAADRVRVVRSVVNDTQPAPDGAPPSRVQFQLR